MTNFFNHYTQQAIHFLPRLCFGLLIFLIGWLVAVIVKYMIMRLSNHSAQRRYLYRLLGQSAKVAILVAGTITALGTMDINVTALVTSLGLVGFALGIALKDPLSNVLAGFMVLFYQPFCVGQTIKINTAEGEVIDINLRYTVLQTDSQKTLIPNATILNSMVTVLNSTHPQDTSST